MSPECERELNGMNADDRVAWLCAAVVASHSESATAPIRALIRAAIAMSRYLGSGDRRSIAAALLRAGLDVNHGCDHQRRRCGTLAGPW